MACLRSFSWCFCRCHSYNMLLHCMDVKQVIPSPKNVGASGVPNITARLWTHWSIRTCVARGDMAKHFPKMSRHPSGVEALASSNVIPLGHIYHKSVLHPVICIFLMKVLYYGKNWHFMWSNNKFPFVAFYFILYLDITFFNLIKVLIWLFF